MSTRVPCGVATIITHRTWMLSNGVVIPQDMLLGLRKGSHGAGSWSIPGGKVEPGELPIITAQREVEEETGMRVSPLPFLLMPYNNTFAGGEPWVTLYFICQVENMRVPEVKEPDKCEQWGWFSFNGLPDPLFEPLAELVRCMRKAMGEHDGG